MNDSAGNQGMQIGNDNVQLNTWNYYYQAAAEGTVSLGAYSVSHAADLIRGMDRDDAMRELATAEVAPAAAVLGAILNTDEALVISLLANIDRVKAGQMIEAITPLPAGREWLQQLPEAAAKIDSRAYSLKWTDPGLLERADYSRVVSHRKKKTTSVPGYRRCYRDGQIYWSEDGGAHAITGAILARYEASRAGTQQFGFPTGEAIRIASDDGARWVQRFSSRAVYRHESSVIGVAQAVATYLDARGGASQFYPLGAAITVTSRHGPRAWMQRFKGSRTASSETVFYDGGRVYGISGEIEDLHRRLNGPNSWLGLPTSNAAARGSTLAQEFEGGTVFTGTPGARTVAVPAATMTLIRGEGLDERLGFPVTAETPADSGDDRWQFFENGVVTLRDGKREVWVRPEVRELGPSRHANTSVMRHEADLLPVNGTVHTQGHGKVVHVA